MSHKAASGSSEKYGMVKGGGGGNEYDYGSITSLINNEVSKKLFSDTSQLVMGSFSLLFFSAFLLSFLRIGDGRNLQRGLKCAKAVMLYAIIQEANGSKNIPSR